MKSDTVIVSYSLDGKLLRTYPSAKKASESLKVFSRVIDKCIREGGTVKDKQWRRFPANKIPDHIEPYHKVVTSRSIKPIAEIDEHNKVIKTYPSIRNASILNNTDAHTIRDVLLGKTRLARGKRYRYLNNDEIEKYGYVLGEEINIEKTSIIQLSLNGEYVKTYKSISEACKALNKNGRNQEIKNCLNGKYSTAFGYIWKYKNKTNVIREKKPMIIQMDKDTGLIINKYKSVKEASLATSISVPNINNCIRGRQKKAGGYIWKRR